MRKVILWMQQSIDGYIEGPNGEFDWPIVEEELHTYFNDQSRDVDVFMYGRKVYEGMSHYWPTADTDPSSTEQSIRYARTWKRTPKIVFSRTLDEAGWDTRIVSDDIATEIAALKAQPGQNLVLYGEAEIAAAFMQLDLIDEYWLFVHPVVLGAGTRLFPTLDDRRNLQLVESRAFHPGVVHLRYARPGDEG